MVAPALEFAPKEPFRGVAVKPDFVAKFLTACFACVTAFALLWPQVATAHEATLTVRSAPLTQPMLAAETAIGEPIDITALEANSVVMGPLVTTKLTVDLASHSSTAELRVRLPRDAVVLEWERETLGCGEAQSVFTAGVWSKMLRSRRTSLVVTQPLVQGAAVVASVSGRAPVARLEATLSDETGHALAAPVVATELGTSTDVAVQLDSVAEAYRASDLAMINAHVDAARVSAPIQNTIILLDTSASSAQELSHRIEQAQAIARVTIGRLALVTFDQSTEVVFRGKANDFTNAIFETVAQRGALGATNLESAFHAVEILAQNRDYQRVILLTDGITTLGTGNQGTLSSLVRRWLKFGIRRLDIVAPAFGGDHALLEGLVATSLPEHGRLISDIGSLVVRLEQPSTRDLPISILGAISQKPWAITSPSPNEEQWLLARVPEGLPLKLRVDGKAPKLLDAQPAWRPLFERYFQRKQLLPAVEESKQDEFVLERGTLSLSHSRKVTYCASFDDWTGGRMPPEVIQRIVRLNFGRFRGCATQNHRAPIVPKGRVTAQFVIGTDGSVTSVTDVGSTVNDKGFVRCVLEAFTALRFAPLPDGTVTVVYPLVFVDGEEETKPDYPARSYADDVPKTYVPVKISNSEYALPPRDVGLEGYEGGYRNVIESIRENKLDVAETYALGLRQKHPNALVSYLARGKVAEAKGDSIEARRAYGSLIDRFEGNAPLLRMAAAWLAQLGDRTSRALAAVALKKALELNDERTKSERQLGWLYAEDGDYEAALGLLTEAFLHQENREPSLLNREISIVASVALARRPEHEGAIVAQLRRSGTSLTHAAGLAIALEDETAHGLELSVYTSTNQKRFRATDTYGYDGHASAYEIAPVDRRTPYTLRVTDRSGAGSSFPGALGIVRIFDYDGKRNLRVELRPFILQAAGADVDLGTYENGVAERKLETRQ